MVAQFQAQISTEITHSYTDFDGVQVDVLTMTYPNGYTEHRQCWADDTNLDGETVFYLKTSDKSVVQSNWKNSKNNKWLTAYQALWIERYQAECLEFQAGMDTLAYPEYYTEDDYRKAKADLGF